MSGRLAGAGRWALVGSALLGLAAIAAAGCGGGGSSPGPLIVYEAKSLGTTNVWTIDPKSEAATQLTFGESYDGNPGWSPDHRQIIFSSDRNRARNVHDLYVMDADGSNVRRLTDTNDDAEWSATYSPDGTQFAYVVQSAGSYFVATMASDGSDQQHVAGPYTFAEFPAWRNDGREVYFSAIKEGQTDADIYSYDVDTQAVQTRISTPAPDTCPHFTHDGKTLLYASAAPGDAKNIDLYAHDLASDETTGAHDTRLTSDAAVDDYGNPSPDDRTIVFISDREDASATYGASGDSSGDAELYLMDRDGKHQRRLTNTPDSRENVPDW